MRNLLFRLSLIAASMLGSVVGAHAATIAYDASLGSLPTAQGWTAIEGGGPFPALSVSAGALHQGMTSDSGHQYWDYTNATFDFSTGTVAVSFRLKIVSASFSGYPRGGYTVFLTDSAGRLSTLYLSSGAVFLGNNQTNSVSSIVSFDTTDAFHDYVLNIGPTGSALSVDGNAIVSMGLGGVTSPANHIDFGDGTVLARNESYLEYFNVSGVTLINVPEPGSLALLGSACVAAAAVRRRKRAGS